MDERMHRRAGEWADVNLKPNVMLEIADLPMDRPTDRPAYLPTYLLAS